MLCFIRIVFVWSKFSPLYALCLQYIIMYTIRSPLDSDCKNLCSITYKCAHTRDVGISLLFYVFRCCSTYFATHDGDPALTWSTDGVTIDISRPPSLLARVIRDFIIPRAIIFGTSTFADRWCLFDWNVCGGEVAMVDELMIFVFYVLLRVYAYILDNKLCFIRISRELL